ncbi:MAG: hypothetical protein KY395_02630 [Actinobacteria bacterium]|nr:hypothetical protein [Actinomycetota bacterium]
MRLVLTHHRRFRKAALEETSETLGEPRVVEEPDHSVTVVDVPDGDVRLLKTTTFVQHVAPADIAIEIDGSSQDLHRLLQAAEGFAGGVEGHFAVQCRRGAHSGGASHVEAEYTTRDVEIALGRPIEARGAVVDLDRPSQILSTYLGASTAYLGLSTGEDNKRTLVAQHSRYTQPPAICRAERKLDEAIDLWELGGDLREAAALDVGASPGGWSWVLASAGARVTAVDPGELDERVANHPLVSHLKTRAETLEFGEATFDWLVNDMNVDPPLAAEVLLRARPWLRPGGRAVSTLKMAGRSRPREVLASFVSRLEPGYALEASQHLYSNRQEVTLLLRRS